MPNSPRPSGTIRRLLFRAGMLAAAFFAGCSVVLLFMMAERNTLLEKLIVDTTRDIPRADVDSTVLSLSRAVFEKTNRGIPAAELPLYERLEATSPFNVGTTVALKHGIYGIVGHEVYGPCGTMTRVLLNACWSLGIRARKLQLAPRPDDPAGGHTMLEFWSDGRWQVISPSDSSFVWRTHDGRIATLEEIRSDSTIFAQVFDRYPNYPFNFERPSNIRWEKLPAPARAVFRLVLGPEGYARAETPRLYDQPRTLFFWLALLATLLITASTWLIRPRRTR